MAGCSEDEAPTGAGPTAAVSQQAQRIGPEGGVVTANGVTLTVPAGAVTTATEFTVSPTARAAYALPGGVEACSEVVTFGPAGARFAKALTVSLAHRCGPSPTAYWSNQTATAYEALPVTQPVAGRVNFEVTHFSEGVVGQPVGAGGTSPGGAGGSAGTSPGGAGGSAGTSSRAGVAGSAGNSRGISG